MKKKKLIILIIVTILCIGNFVFALDHDTTESSDLISLEEYTNRLTELYNQYNLYFEVVDGGNYRPMSRDVFELHLNEIEQEFINEFNYRDEINEQIINLNKGNKLGNDDITPFVMPITVNLQERATIVHPSRLASVTIAFRTSGTYDGENGLFISVNSPGTWWNLYSVNFDDVNYSVKRWFTNRTQCVAHAEGVAKFSWTDPGSGATIKVEHPFTIVRGVSY